MIGGFLVAAAAVVVFAAALSAAGGQRGSYVVAARPLAAGSIIGPGDTTTARLGLSGPTAAASFHQGGLLIGRALSVPVRPGELIQASMLGSPAGHLRPVSIPVDSDSLAALGAGESVDVLSTPASSASSASSSASPAGAATSSVSVVLRGATLISAGHADGGLLSGTGSGTVVVTLGVADLDEVEQLVQAAHSGTVELVQAEPGDGTGPGPGSGPVSQGG
ncbi:MAG TPA: SAF domain-containing protein [Acidimicrobiales bacterium]|nr:SAF domain-containing protein [Acidimicrobiales bacterium]